MAEPVSVSEPAEPATWLGRLERDHDNVRAAIGWSLGHGREAWERAWAESREMTTEQAVAEALGGRLGTPRGDG